MSLERRVIGPLAALVAAGQSSKTVVLCHGYGADASDLASLSTYLDPTGCYTWVFPEAPLVVPLGPAMSGRAWFPIVMSELEALGRHRDYTGWSMPRPAGLDAAQSQLAQFIAALQVPVADLLLGGFSQGAMVTLDLVLNLGLRPAGLALLSGTLLDRPTWQGQAAALAGLAFFQSHGTDDAILPLALAEELAGLLQKAGWQGALHAFPGGHSIPIAVLEGLAAFLRARLGPSA